MIVSRITTRIVCLAMALSHVDPATALPQVGLALTPPHVGLDTFGIAQLHPSQSGFREWNSAHWSNGVARLIAYSGDAYDPTGWTDNHSSSSGDSLFVNGKGVLLIKGGGPRFHINSTELYAGSNPTPKVAPQAFVNVEATGYCRRLTTGGSNWDGIEIQARTGPLAHASAGGNDCDATGYAARFRDDGTWDWEKELKHPDSKVYSTRAGFDAPLFGGKTIPLNRWIGMKFLAYNVDGGIHVRLETYIDSVSDVSATAPADGGHWELVGAMTDDGTNFPSGDISGCPDLAANMAVTKGNGTLLLRTDNEACEWKMVSVREIDAASTAFLLDPRDVRRGEVNRSEVNRGLRGDGYWVPYRAFRSWEGGVGFIKPGETTPGGIWNVRGRRFPNAQGRLLPDDVPFHRDP